MLRTHKIRLNPTTEQAQYFLRASGIARFAWNTCLDEYKRRKAAGETVDWNQIKKSFRRRIDSEFPWCREVTKCAAEEAIADLRRSITTYYKVKKGGAKAVHFPGFRKRSKKVGGFGISNSTFRCERNSVLIPKLGWVNMAEPLRFVGKIIRGRIVEKVGRWYIAILVDVEDKVPEAAGSIGIDFGLAKFATLSNGKIYETQAYLRRAERKLRLLQRGLSRKKKGSANRAKWKVRVTRQHERVANQRADFLHKMTTEVSLAFGMVSVEDLSLAGLCRTRLAKSFHDAGIGEAIRQLGYKARLIQKVDRFFPSSQLCHACKWQNRTLTLSDREWACRSCGEIHNRDENAAKNIDLEGIRLLAGSGYISGTPVEFATSLVPFGVLKVADCEAGTRLYSDGKHV